MHTCWIPNTEPQAHPQFTLQTGKTFFDAEALNRTRNSVEQLKQETNEFFEGKKVKLIIRVWNTWFVRCSMRYEMPIVAQSKINSFHNPRKWIPQQERCKIRKRNCFQRLAFDGRENINSTSLGFWFVKSVEKVSSNICSVEDEVNGVKIWSFVRRLQMKCN